MSPLLFIGIRGAAGVIANRTLKKSKNIPTSFMGGVLSFLFPLPMLAVNALRRRRPARGRNEREQQLFDRRFSIEEKERGIRRRQGLKDRLETACDRVLGRRSRLENQRHTGVVTVLLAVTSATAGVLAFASKRNDRRLELQRGDLRDQYELLARFQRNEEGIKAERFAGILMRHDSPDGRPRFVFPYDMPKELRLEAQMLLADKFNVNPNEKDRFTVGTHRSAETTLYRKDQSVMVFDAKERRVTPLGVGMSERVQEMVGATVGRHHNRCNAVLLKDNPVYGAPEGVITMDPIGKEAVALNLNGVTLAFAVAGPDGKVRAMGHGVSGNDKSGLRLASQLNERLKGCTDMSDWVERASKIVLSDDNLRSGIEQRDRNRSVARELKQKKDMRESILNAPKHSLKQLSGGLKRL